MNGDGEPLQISTVEDLNTFYNRHAEPFGKRGIPLRARSRGPYRFNALAFINLGSMVSK